MKSRNDEFESLAPESLASVQGGALSALAFKPPFLRRRAAKPVAAAPIIRQSHHPRFAAVSAGIVAGGCFPPATVGVAGVPGIPTNTTPTGSMFFGSQTEPMNWQGNKAKGTNGTGVIELGAGRKVTVGIQYTATKKTSQFSVSIPPQGGLGPNSVINVPVPKKSTTEQKQQIIEAAVRQVTSAPTPQQQVFGLPIR